MRKKEENRKRLRVLSYGLMICLTAVLFMCQLLIFKNWDEIGISILIGTCGTMVGCFSAVLASPYNPGDRERLSKVGSIISTLITGYIVAKIVDPLIAAMTHESRIPLIFELKNGANVLVAIICFLGGFLLVYQYRVYISGEILETELLLKQETVDKIKNEISPNEVKEK